MSRYPRRSQRTTYAGLDEEGDTLMQDEDIQEEAESGDSSSDELGEDEEEFERIKSRRVREQRGKENVGPVRRTSSRANKFQSSMAEPQGISDLLASKTNNARRGRKHGREPSSPDSTTSEESSEKPRKRKSREKRDSLVSLDDDDEEYNPKRRSSPELQDTAESEDGDDEDEEPLKIQRIIASKTELRKVWKEVASKMNTCLVDNGSAWHQDDSGDDDAVEERYLVKWNNFSFLHCSWETAKDLEEQIENAKTYVSTFFRKSRDGLLYSAEERCDGDFFDPAFKQVDRILAVHPPEGYEVELTVDGEDKLTHKDLGIVTDKNDPGFEDGVGRVFLVKWGNQPYEHATEEYERDLIINDIDYKPHVKAFLKRRAKPSRALLKSQGKALDAEKRKLYKLFGANSKSEDEAKKAAAVKEYQTGLLNHVYKNGGQLRDYQTEGVAWMVSNYINDRSCILCDEMGTGKTLQTAATLDIITTIQPQARFLVIAPLSTIPHWLREFQSWTDLNAIVYHGSAEDRRTIREFEMAYEEDRPQTNSTNANYLRRCKPRGNNKRNNKNSVSPWMVQVVIATPEMLVTEDAFELAEISWDVLVVDEAHRLKNHNSKLAINLRNDRFQFGFKILCTGTPIQNEMKELWTLLNFVDAESFQDMDSFLEKYGDMKSKESVDELHDTLRPYILRRLKEDVEKSVPPKEETIIEVELTLSQKQYYRALYEKNVQFLHKGKSKALDGPSLNNLAMQLRKCCNHVCLLNGIEEELKKQHAGMTDTDFLVRGSGKLVLLDKLLPRLKEEGHRVLIFSQFKIMLDILEDYLSGRGMSFGRIDGSITGLKRQMAIDRFQSQEDSAPYVMLLTTRSGGVGINLTAADTVIIYDSDWNPQNDLQAQARCHRIGQKRAVKVYRLLSSRSYELQMFDLSSKKMGLDQAVLKGVESGEGAISKEEVEKLLKHGAYAMFSEEKDGKAETASNEFVEQDIDSILARRTRTIVHKSGGNSGNAGSTFSKASFKMAVSPNKSEDVDVDDPDFWKKMLGDSYQANESVELDPKQRRRDQKNYAEDDANDMMNDDSSYDSEDSSGSESETTERARWGGSKPTQWKKEEVERLERFLYSYGYGNVRWDVAAKLMGSRKGELELKRMAWSLLLTLFLDASEHDATSAEKRQQKAAEKQRQRAETADGGGILVASVDGTAAASSCPSREALVENAFRKLWAANVSWAPRLIEDAVAYATTAAARSPDAVASSNSETSDDGIEQEFAQLWGSLRNRGWKASVITDVEDSNFGKTMYSYQNQSFDTIIATVQHAYLQHPELSQVFDKILKMVAEKERRLLTARAQAREKHLSLTFKTATVSLIKDFLACYAPLQLVVDRADPRPMNFGRRILVSIPLLTNLFSFLQKANLPPQRPESTIKIAALLGKKHKALPHPQWTSHQDAVLLQAIHRHGFIELDSNYQGMLTEKAPWGQPFDPVPPRPPSRAAADSGSLDLLVCIAERAADFMGKLGTLEEASKYVDKDAIATHFCLQKVALPAAQDSSPLVEQNQNLPRWQLSKDELLSKFKPFFSEEPVPLPTKKELTKRAKALLGATLDGSKSDESQSGKQTEHRTSDVGVLDQKDPTNALAALILRGLLKTPAQNKECARQLANRATEEAEFSLKKLSQIRETLKEPDDKLERKIHSTKHLVGLLQSVDLTQPPQLWKNVLRVILGEPQIQTKSDHKLPPAKSPPVKNPQVADTSFLSLSYGQRAIAEAGNKQAASGSGFVRLTAIETVIVSAACSHGVPVWSHESENLVEPLAGLTMGWRDFGEKVWKISESSLIQAKRTHDKPISSISMEGRVAGLSAKQSLQVAIKCKEEAEKYKSEPKVLAKKTVLLMGKLLKRSSVSGSHFDRGLGGGVLKWFGGQVRSWATSLCLVDTEDEPLTFTAVDFLEEASPQEQSRVCVMSCFDNQGCREVYGQMACVTRLRGVLCSHNVDAVFARIQQAVMNAKDGDWAFVRPASWRSGADDVGLLNRLLRVGLRDLVQDDSQIADKAFREHRLSEVSVQMRVNALVRELHNIEEATSTPQSAHSGSGEASERPLQENKRKLTEDVEGDKKLRYV